MSTIGKTLQALDGPNAAHERAIATRLLSEVFDSYGCVRFPTIVSFDDYVRVRYGLELAQNSTDFVLPDGRHLFYVSGKLLMRVKTTGTGFRPTPHMTMSLVVGLSWDDELGKFNRRGELIPKLGAVRRADWRSLTRAGETTQALEEVDDRWANACHFNFASGFDGSGAPNLQCKSKLWVEDWLKSLQ